MTQGDKEHLLKQLDKIHVPFHAYIDDDYRDGFYDCLKEVARLVRAIEVNDEKRRRASYEKNTGTNEDEMPRAKRVPELSAILRHNQ